VTPSAVTHCPPPSLFKNKKNKHTLYSTEEQFLLKATFKLSQGKQGKASWAGIRVPSLFLPNGELVKISELLLISQQHPHIK